MQIFAYPSRMFHVKRYNRTYRLCPATRMTPSVSEVRQGHHSDLQRYAGGPRVGLRIIGVWLPRRSSPSASEQLADLALSVALLQAVISPSQSMGSISRYLASPSCLPSRLKRSGWRFYRSSPQRSLLYPDRRYRRDPFNPVALRAAELARKLREPR